MKRRNVVFKEHPGRNRPGIPVIALLPHKNTVVATPLNRNGPTRSAAGKTVTREGAAGSVAAHKVAIETAKAESANETTMMEAIKAITAWAFTQPKVTTILAETENTNLPSHRTLEKNHFTRYKTAGIMDWWKLERPVFVSSGAEAASSFA
ncbi:GNAT family N-acetyltransferase [Pontibacter diazotrophicus]|nr:GNAT family protein [Pontibacter diazotrophicus]